MSQVRIDGAISLQLSRASEVAGAAVLDALPVSGPDLHIKGNLRRVIAIAVHSFWGDWGDSPHRAGFALRAIDDLSSDGCVVSAVAATLEPGGVILVRFKAIADPEHRPSHYHFKRMAALTWGDWAKDIPWYSADSKPTGAAQSSSADLVNRAREWVLEAPGPLMEAWRAEKFMREGVVQSAPTTAPAHAQGRAVSRGGL